MVVHVFDLDLTLFSIESNRLPACDPSSKEYYYMIHNKALSVVRDILSQGNDQVCIASRSKYKQRCLDTLEHHGFPSSSFAHIVIEHTSEAQGKTPHLQEIIKKLQIKDVNQIILYDDSMINCRSAQKLGCRYVHVQVNTGLTCAL